MKSQSRIDKGMKDKSKLQLECKRSLKSRICGKGSKMTFWEPPILIRWSPGTLYSLSPLCLGESVWSSQGPTYQTISLH